MKTVLKAVEWKVYNYLYIQHKSEEEVAKLMNYKTSEKNRVPGYKQIKNIKKSIIEKVKSFRQRRNRFMSDFVHDGVSIPKIDSSFCWLSGNQDQATRPL